MLLFLLLAAAFKASVTAPAVAVLAEIEDSAPSFIVLGRELPDCVNPARYRTMSEIIWSCLATIFSCTWVALHPNVPSSGSSGWKILKCKLFMMACALIGPECMTIWALRQRIGAARHRDEYNKYFKLKTSNQSILSDIRDWFRGRKRAPEDDTASGGSGNEEEKIGDVGNQEPLVPWTLTHGFLLEMGGLVTYNNKQTHIITEVDQLPKFTSNRSYVPFNVREEDLKDRSKRDGLTKLIVILQTSWFILQCVARWITRLPVTELEVVTVAFAFLTVITYALWWNKPQNMCVSACMPVPKEAELRLVPVTGMRQDSTVGAYQRTGGQIGPHGKEFWKASTKSLAQKLVFKSRIFSPVSPFVAMLGYHFEDQRPGPQNDIFYSSTEPRDVKRWDVLILLGLAGMIFGALHLIPVWRSSFPSHQEKLLWKLSAAWITAEPLVILALKPSLWACNLRICVFLLFALVGASGMMCIISRLTLIVLAFTTLRGLPPEAYKNVQWGTFLPHW